VTEALSAWLSQPEDFTAEQRVVIEGHLATCQVCQTTLEELRTIVLALAALPEASPVRSFALSPDMVSAPTPVNLRETPGRPVVLTESRPWYERQLAALRWATAVAAILFVFVVSADFVSRNPAGDQSADDAASVMFQAESTTAGASVEESSRMTGEDDAAGAADEANGGAAEQSEGDGAVADDAAESAAGEDMAVMEAEAEEEAPAAATEAALEPQPASGKTDDADDTVSDDEVIAYSATAEAFGDASDSTAADDVARESSDETLTGLAQEQADDTAGDATAAIAEDDGSTWRLLQVGLALLIVWLLAAMIALPRLRPRAPGTDRE
jgi:hypothetical protein